MTRTKEALVCSSNKHKSFFVFVFLVRVSLIRSTCCCSLFISVVDVMLSFDSPFFVFLKA